MKRIALYVCFLGIFSLTCFGSDLVLHAQTKGTPPPASLPKKITNPEIKPLEVRGRTEAVRLADPSMGIRPEISITGEDGKRYSFLIRSTTTIYGQDWKAIPLEKLVIGEYVRVQYNTNEYGKSVALSIKPLGKKKPQ